MSARGTDDPGATPASAGGCGMSAPITAPAIRYHGGKFRLAPWVMGFFPPHRIYIEPFGGAAGVLLRKPRAYAEVYNDLDDELCNFFRVLQDDATRQRLTELLVLTPYSRREFEQAWLPDGDPVERARRLIIRAQMGFGAAGATKSSTGFRIDVKREYETAQHVWARYPDGIAALGLRLAGVLLENRPAIEVIRAHDTPETLFYVDPPYVLDTRCRVRAGAGRAYRHELSDADHRALLDTLQGVQGMVVLSGYPHRLYDETLAGWERHDTTARIAAGRGTAVRTECVWLNPACARARPAAQLCIDMDTEGAA